MRNVRKFGFAIIASAALSLGACVPGQLPISNTTDAQVQADITNVTNQAVAAIKTGCNYVAPVAEVASIITSFTGGSGVAALVGQVASSVCTAVTAKGASLGGGAPQVNGVVLHGHFLGGARSHR